ncbi:hypothetical protein L1987_00888 [Smallanthus sonchifolius]|uniref:Uncharacterized protein n=1 Tax=Smallanthus sonchifolius TaxID=185202 RepID=A0ACB9K3J9_9ASTR|nr:hypothetical protein L1987_00888 [Smallanthus sonchifolius]
MSTSNLAFSSLWPLPSVEAHKRFRRMDLQMSEKRKRRASTCKKKLLSSDQSEIEFNANGIAIGKKAADFMSWVGAEFKNRILINKVAKDVDSKLYNRIWEYTKETWKIPDDHAKHTTLRKGKAKSQKARMSAAKNIDPTRIGRWGYSGLETVFESRWKQLVKSYPALDVVQDDGFKTKKKQSQARESAAATSPSICGSSRASGSSYNDLTDIEILNTESLRHSVSVPDYRSHKTVEPSRDSSSTDYRPELVDDHFSQNRTEPFQFY